MNTRIRMAAPAQVGASTAVGGGLELTGTNGTLRITELRLVVDEFELDREDDSCSSGSGSCADFERKLFSVDVPLGSGSLTIVSDRIPAGTYKELEFEVENLIDDDLDDDSQRKQALLAELRTKYPDWPAAASMMVIGTFTPTGGAPQAFRSYFDADIEIEYDLVPQLTVVDGETVELTIDLRPDLWFRNGDGTVRNLSLFNYPTNPTLVDFKAEFEDGVRIRFGR